MPTISFDWAAGYISPFSHADGQYTTPHAVIERLLDAIVATRQQQQRQATAQSSSVPLRLVDLGSGDGRVVLAAARRGLSATGVELDKSLVDGAHAAAAAEGLGSSASFECGSLLDAELSADVDAVVAYLLPDALRKLARRLAAINFTGRLYALRWCVDDAPELELCGRLRLDDDSPDGGESQGGGARWVAYEYVCLDSAHALREAEELQRAWRAAREEQKATAPLAEALTEKQKAPVIELEDGDEHDQWRDLPADLFSEEGRVPGAAACGASA